MITLEQALSALETMSQYLSEYNNGNALGLTNVVINGDRNAQVNNAVFVLNPVTEGRQIELLNPVTVYVNEV